MTERPTKDSETLAAIRLHMLGRRFGNGFSEQDAERLLAALPPSAPAALAVERLARATWNVNRRDWEEKGGQWPKDFAHEPSQSVWTTEAEAIAAEYARLKEPVA